MVHHATFRINFIINIHFSIQASELCPFFYELRRNKGDETKSKSCDVRFTWGDSIGPRTFTYIAFHPLHTSATRCWRVSALIPPVIHVSVNGKGRGKYWSIRATLASRASCTTSERTRTTGAVGRNPVKMQSLHLIHDMASGNYRHERCCTAPHPSITPPHMDAHA